VNRGSAIRLPAVSLLACAWLAACGAERPEPAPGAPIVLVSIDTLRADRLPAYGYAAGRTPAIDALAAGGVLVERAYTAYPLTLPSHATLLSGQLPPHHGVRDNAGFRFDARSHPCFPKALAAHGYSTGAFVSAWMMRGASGLGDCFQVYDDDTGGLGGSGEQRSGAATFERARSWLGGVAKQPFFLFLHLYEPHAPYAPPEPFARQFADPYDGEVAAADAVVGELVAELRRLGRYEDALIMLVSDHGEGLGDHGELRHGVLLYQETIRVPWILKLPHGAWRGRRLTGPVSLADLAPTLLEAVGIAPESGTDGLAIFGSRRDADRTPIYVETWYPRLRLGWSELAAMIDRRYSTISGPKPELYDLEHDPGERHDLAGEMRRLVSERVAQARAIDSPPAAPETADPETLAKLAALGYVGAGAAVPATASGSLPDPRDRVRALTRFEEAIQADSQGDAARAERELAALLAENPGMVEALPFLARAEMHLGRKDDALATLRRAYAQDAHPSIALQLAEVLIERGELAEAERLAESVRPTDPRRAYPVLIAIAERRGDPVAARRWSDEAIAAGAAGTTILRERARELAEAGHPDEAVRLLEPHAAGADPESLALLGLALAESGRAPDGFTLLARARREAPASATVAENLGVVALRLDRTTEALEALEAAVRMAPQSASAWTSLGVARFRTGSPPGALEAWKRAATLDPDRTDALYNLGFVAARLGDRATARDALRRFLTVATDAPETDRESARHLLAELGG
jgi:tetratricopeptide (TPR) repeat protein